MINTPTTRILDDEVDDAYVGDEIVFNNNDPWSWCNTRFSQMRELIHAFVHEHPVLSGGLGYEAEERAVKYAQKLLGMLVAFPERAGRKQLGSAVFWAILMVQHVQSEMMGGWEVDSEAAQASLDFDSLHDFAMSIKGRKFRCKETDEQDESATSSAAAASSVRGFSHQHFDEHTHKVRLLRVDGVGVNGSDTRRDRTETFAELFERATDEELPQGVLTMTMPLLKVYEESQSRFQQAKTKKILGKAAAVTITTQDKLNFSGTIDFRQRDDKGRIVKPKRAVKPKAALKSKSDTEDISLFSDEAKLIRRLATEAAKTRQDAAEVEAERLRVLEEGRLAREEAEDAEWGEKLAPVRALLAGPGSKAFTDEHRALLAEYNARLAKRKENAQLCQKTKRKQPARVPKKKHAVVLEPPTRAQLAEAFGLAEDAFEAEVHALEQKSKILGRGSFSQPQVAMHNAILQLRIEKAKYEAHLKKPKKKQLLHHQCNPHVDRHGTIKPGQEDLFLERQKVNVIKRNAIQNKQSEKMEERIANSSARQTIEEQKAKKRAARHAAIIAKRAANKATSKAYQAKVEVSRHKRGVEQLVVTFKDADGEPGRRRKCIVKTQATREANKLKQARKDAKRAMVAYKKEFQAKLCEGPMYNKEVVVYKPVIGADGVQVTSFVLLLGNQVSVSATKTEIVWPKHTAKALDMLGLPRKAVYKGVKMRVGGFATKLTNWSPPKDVRLHHNHAEFEEPIYDGADSKVVDWILHPAGSAASIAARVRCNVAPEEFADDDDGGDGDDDVSMCDMFGDNDDDEEDKEDDESSSVFSEISNVPSSEFVPL